MSEKPQTLSRSNPSVELPKPQTTPRKRQLEQSDLSLDNRDKRARTGDTSQPAALPSADAVRRALQAQRSPSKISVRSICMYDYMSLQLT